MRAVPVTAGPALVAAHHHCHRLQIGR
jgi:hypothetical protein